jgi:hypothetical protein
MRSILRPAFSASSRHRCSSFSNALWSTASFFNGWRSTLGTIPATSQRDWLISMTVISVASCSRVTRDLLKSFSCGMGRSIDSLERRWCIVLAARRIASFSALFTLWLSMMAAATGFPLRLFATLLIKRVVDPFQRAVIGPEIEVAVDRAFRRQVLRDRAPLTAAGPLFQCAKKFRAPEDHAIDYLPLRQLLLTRPRNAAPLEQQNLFGLFGLIGKGLAETAPVSSSRHHTRDGTR